MSNQSSGREWKQNDEVKGNLVALDISGFSKDVNPNALAEHRSKFFHAVEATTLFPCARGQQDVKVHFLGDELRLAFRVNVKAADVSDFVKAVFTRLDKWNREVPEAKATRLKGVVLKGVVIWKQWRDCDFLNGVLPGQAQRWMSKLAPNQVAMNEDFWNSLVTAGDAVPSEPFELSGESAYLPLGERDA